MFIYFYLLKKISVHKSFHVPNKPLTFFKLRYLIHIFKTVLSSGYILILLSIEYILASLIEMCQGQSRMRNVK